jgi:ABC-type molybdate transport system substrate-binding protein
MCTSFRQAGIHASKTTGGSKALAERVMRLHNVESVAAVADVQIDAQEDGCTREHGTVLTSGRTREIKEASFTLL